MDYRGRYHEYDEEEETGCMVLCDIVTSGRFLCHLYTLIKITVAIVLLCKWNDPDCHLLIAFVIASLSFAIVNLIGWHLIKNTKTHNYAAITSLIVLSLLGGAAWKFADDCQGTGWFVYTCVDVMFGGVILFGIVIKNCAEFDL